LTESLSQTKSSPFHRMGVTAINPLKTRKCKFKKESVVRLTPAVVNILSASVSRQTLLTANRLHPRCRRDVLSFEQRPGVSFQPQLKCDWNTGWPWTWSQTPILHQASSKIRPNFLHALVADTKTSGSTR